MPVSLHMFGIKFVGILHPPDCLILEGLLGASIDESLVCEGESTVQQLLYEEIYQQSLSRGNVVSDSVSLSCTDFSCEQQVYIADAVRLSLKKHTGSDPFQNSATSAPGSPVTPKAHSPGSLILCLVRDVCKCFSIECSTGDENLLTINSKSRSRECFYLTRSVYNLKVISFMINTHFSPTLTLLYDVVPIAMPAC